MPGESDLSTPETSIRREYPAAPLVGVGAIILEGDRVLLVKRGRQPSKGEWSIPGGLVRVGETLSQAVVREAEEETGLVVRPRGLVELLERIFRDDAGRPRYHYVLADYLCEVIGGSLVAGSDAAEVTWAARSDLTTLRLAPVTMDVIEKAFQAAGQHV